LAIVSRVFIFAFAPCGGPSLESKRIAAHHQANTVLRILLGEEE